VLAKKGFIPKEKLGLGLSFLKRKVMENAENPGSNALFPPLGDFVASAW
jgi:hypothetical protein